MTPNGDGSFKLTRAEYVDLIEMRRSVKNIEHFIRALPCKAHMKAIATIKGRMVAYGFIVTVCGILIGKLL